MSDCIINPITGRAIKKTGATYKQLVKKKNKTAVLENVLKAKKDKNEYDEKKQAGTILQSAIRRKNAKLPEPPKPVKKFGFEDLDEGVKDIISGIVKKNKSRKEMNKDLKNIYDIFIAILRNKNGYDMPEEIYENKHLKKYNKLTDDELYDFLYKGGIKKEMIDLLNRSKLNYFATDRNYSPRNIKGELTTAELRSLPDDKGDNLEFKKYYKNKNLYNIQLYYQHKTDDFFVLVNPLEIGENVLKLLKLRLPDDNDKFLMNDKVSNIKNNKYLKINTDTVITFLRNKEFVVNYGIVMMPSGYLDISLYDKMIKQGLDFIEKIK